MIKSLAIFFLFFSNVSLAYTDDCPSINELSTVKIVTAEWTGYTTWWTVYSNWDRIGEKRGRLWMQGPLGNDKYGRDPEVAIAAANQILVEDFHRIQKTGNCSWRLYDKFLAINFEQETGAKFL